MNNRVVPLLGKLGEIRNIGLDQFNARVLQFLQNIRAHFFHFAIY